MATTVNNLKDIDDNPWKGLNFYVEGEVLYGRDKEIQALSRYIINNSQTVLYGKSGIGKSSIINAGIFPIARHEGLCPVPLRLKHDKKDHLNYLSQIKDAFIESCIDFEPLVPVINEDSETLWEFFHRHRFYHHTSHEVVRPLVVLDQFEEIFSIQQDEKVKKEFFSQLADLINEVTPRYIYDAQHTSDGPDDETTWQNLQDFVRNLSNRNKRNNYIEGSNFNMVFVLREDFLSYFERYTAYIPAMKTNRFPLLPINEEQAAEIIMKPREGLVSKDVAKLIIQKVTDNADFKLNGIPEIEVSATMLSLYLSRLYLKKGLEKTITAEMVNQFGDYIIKDFYEESVANLPKDEIEKLEDELITNGMRDNSFIKYLIDKEKNPNAISEETINTLVKLKLLRQYPDQKELRVEFMHDILCPVVNERIEQRELAKREEAERRRQIEEQKRRENEIREEEEKKRKEILLKAEQERLRHEQETKQIKERNRKRIKRSIAAATLIMTILAGFLIRYWLYEKPYSCTYANFTTVYGWPVGINEIDPGRIESEIKGTTLGRIIVYYRLTRKGSLNRNPFYKVEVISAYDHKPTTNKFIESPAVGLWCSEFGTDDKAKAFAELQKKTAYWICSTSEQGAKTAGKCTAYGLDDKELYSIQFNRDNTTAGSDKSKYVQWAVYYDASGKQMTINKEGIDRLRQTVNNGRVTSCLFFSMLGVPQMNERKAYGYQYDFNDTTHLLQTVHRVDKFGNKISNDSISYLDYEYGRPKKTSLYEVTYPEPGMIVKNFKNYSDTLAFYNNGILKEGYLHPDINKKDDIISFSYDVKGRPVAKLIRSKGNIVKSKAFTYLHNKVKEIKIIDNGDSYSELYEYPDSTTTVMLFKYNNKNISRSLINEKGDSLCFHKCIQTKDTISEPKYIIETTEYRDTAGLLITSSTNNNDVNLYSKFKVYRDTVTKKNILFEYYFDENDSIKKSEWFQYDEYGNKIAIAVAGVRKNPVRCPKWSWHNICCYKMSVLTPFFADQLESSSYASIQGVNEFGENSYTLMDVKNVLYYLSIDESSIGYFRENVNNSKYIKTGINFSVMTLSVCDMNNSAYFVHILSENGTFFSSGLRDNDIIVSINGKSPTGPVIKRIELEGNCHLTVARANTKDKKYDIHDFNVPTGKPQIHIHQIELTKDERNLLNKCI